MRKSFLNFTVMLALTVLAWFVRENYAFQYLSEIFYSLLALTIVYLIFKVVLEDVISRRIKNQKTRYVSRKAFSIIYMAVFLVLFVRIWVDDPQALLVAYGLIGAGVAIAVQDFFKNFVGGITLFINGMYSVGDRVEIDETTGDVIDIGLMYTRIMEIQGWVKADQATGRIVTVPNGRVLGSSVRNYTADNTFIWDEIALPITYDSDWRKLESMVTDLVAEETQDIAERATREIGGIRRKYYLSEMDTEPHIFLEMTDNWIQVYVRYVTDARKRRRLHNTISRRILEKIEADENLELASATHEIVGMPDINIHQD